MARSLADGIRKIVGPLEDRKRFHTALGEFVAAFGHVEMMVQLLLWKVTGVEIPVAQAIFSGVRTNQAVDYINRTFDAEGKTAERLALADCFRQLALLTRIRNDILHYGYSLYEADAARVSNAIAAHTPEKLREFHVTVTELGGMAKDLRQIAWVLSQATWFGVPIAEATSHPKVAEFFVPWRYKQPQQAGPPDKPRKTPARRSSPRGSSQE